MAQILNGTPDDIDWMHGGTDGWIKVDEIYECEQARCNHIMNNRGARGLVELKFGMELEDAKAESMRKYEAYWRNQVDIFNEGNRKKDRENMGYDPPTKTLFEHAEKLGFKLWEPDYGRKKEKREPKESGEIKVLKEALKDRDKQIEAFEKKFDDLMAKIDEKPTPQKKGPGRPPKKKEEDS